MSQMNPTPSGESTSDTLPSEGIRTLISFLLFVHLFALMVAVAANFRPVSDVRAKLKIGPIRSYLQLLHMDLAYNYHYTYYQDVDDDHFAEIELDWTGKPEEEAEKLLLPDPQMARTLRYQRYRNLMYSMASRIYGENDESLLPFTVSKKLLAERGITSGQHRFRCRRITPMNMLQSNSPDPAERDPLDARYVANAYEADLSFSGSDLIIVKAAAAAQTAPVEQEKPSEDQPSEQQKPVERNQPGEQEK